jgi:putative redox protein
MKVSIKNTEDINFVATTANSTFDVIPKVTSPVEIFAVGMISCSGTDIVSLPKAQGKSVSNLEIEADITRAETNPKIFEHIHLTYSFDSDADDVMAKRWVQSSLETYCSTINMVRNASRFTYSVVHNGEKIVGKSEIISGGGTMMGDDEFGEIGACCS